VPKLKDIRQAGRDALGFGMSRLGRRTPGSRKKDGRRYVLHAATWVDPYPWVTGTFPEKLVFAWLAERGIPFTFQATFPDYPYTTTVEEFRPDFLLEWCKVVIEVQGEYWHSLPDQAEHDAYKFAIYELSGYKCYWFWESDILTNLGGLMSGVTELKGYSGPAGWIWEQQKDDLAGLRYVNAASRRPTAPRLGRR